MPVDVGCPDGSFHSWSCLWGVAGDRQRVLPLFGVLADIEIRGFWAGGGPIIHHHYEVLAWLRTRLSWLHPLSGWSSIWLAPAGASVIHLLTRPVS